MFDVSDAAIAAPHLAVTPTGIPNRKLGVWLFLVSEVMFFTALIGAYIVLRLGNPDWPVPSTVLNIPLTGLNTFFLVCSSVTLVLGFAAAQDGRKPAMCRWLLATVLLGSLFLCIQAYEYHKLIHEGFTPSASIFGSCFFTLTGFHGLHVLGGVIWLIVVTLKAFAGVYDHGRHEGIELAGLYWHFVDLVWIILFTIVYLI